jgi:hypothetical protein
LPPNNFNKFDNLKNAGAVFGFFGWQIVSSL